MHPVCNTNWRRVSLNCCFQWSTKWFTSINIAFATTGLTYFYIASSDGAFKASAITDGRVDSNTQDLYQQSEDLSTENRKSRPWASNSSHNQQWYPVRNHRKCHIFLQSKITMCSASNAKRWLTDEIVQNDLVRIFGERVTGWSAEVLSEYRHTWA